MGQLIETYIQLAAALLPAEQQPQLHKLVVLRTLEGAVPYASDPSRTWTMGAGAGPLKAALKREGVKATVQPAWSEIAS